jgi:cytoskeletal protein RodZ
MDRITCGPLSWTRLHCGMPFVASLRLVRYMRRVSLPVLSLLAQLLQRRLRAKGGAFAFAPTSRRTSGPSSVPGSRARMSRSTPRMRRTRTAAARTRTTTTTTTVATVTVTAAVGAAAAAARTVTAAAAGAATGAAAAGAAPGAAAAAAATGPVARCHWSFRY